MAAAGTLLADGAGARRPQEQLRRQGQQLRLPRELPAWPGRRPFGRIVAHDHAALRHPPDLLRRRQGRLRAARRRLPTTCRSSSRQRADFFEEEVGLETTLKRPIVNTRDEPHCDAQKYRRLHVIVGDANLSEVATFLKVGTTAIVLAMIEDDVLGDRPRARQPGRRRSARSATTCRCAHRRCCADGRRATALEMQWELLERARKYERLARPRRRRRRRSAPTSCARWEAVLDRARARSARAWRTSSTGWPRSAWSSGYRERHGLRLGDARLPAHRPAVPRPARPTGRLAGRGRAASARSPTTRRRSGDDRAAHRHPGLLPGRCLQKWPDDIVAANWDSLVFDIGRDPLRRVPMMEPLRGTAGPRG